MQFAKSYGVLALNILHAGPVGQTATRQLFTCGSACWFRKLPSLWVPRGLNRVPSYAENVYPERGKQVAKNENHADGIQRMDQRAENELEEIENNLFNNRQGQENLNLGNILSKFNTKSDVKPKSFKKTVKSTKNQELHELDLDTLKTLKKFHNTDKPTEKCDSKTKINYCKLKPHHREFCDLEHLVRSRKNRAMQNKLLLEGKRLVLDGLSAGLQLETVLFHDLKLLEGLSSERRNTRFFHLQKHVLQQWSDLVTCPGIIGIFDKPEPMSSVMIPNETTVPLPITVICDNIREPNNLGSVIRSCAAMPVRNVVLLKGCAHPWEPKCLRGGAGAHFRVNIIGPVAMNELVELIPEHASFLVADNEPSRKEENPLAFSRYDAANYRDMEHLVLVIGGETHGISNDLRGFIANFPRHQEATNYTIHIPLENGVESLNTAAALTVILCEIRRQLNYVGT